MYSEYVFDGHEAAPRFWGPIPLNMKEAVTISRPLIKVYRTNHQPIFSQERFSQFCKTLRNIHREHQKLTPNVKKNLELLEEQTAVVEAGHQPALFGGPAFVINKLATIARLATLQNTVPIMFVGDYDHEQKELTVIHLPSPGPRGLTFSMPVPREFKQSPMHVLPLPPQTWFNQALTKIVSTYHELVAGLPKNQKSQYEDRIQTLTTILESTFIQASTISEWSLLLWMRIINLTKDSGILFQVFSNPSLRQLMLPAFEYLMNSKIRSRLIQALNHSGSQLEEFGYTPGIGFRAEDYVPFHLECPTKGCNRTRLDPTLAHSAINGKVEISVLCPKCKTDHSILIKEKSPDLSPWVKFLSPRVDTRAFLVQSYTPVILHVGGAGETDYHAQVSPALEAIQSISPIFFRYSRLYYGNPWTRRQAQKLSNEKLSSLQPSELHCHTSAIATGYNEDNPGVTRSLFAASGEYILETAAQLISDESRLEKERMDTIIQQRETADPTSKKELQLRVGVLTRRRQLVQTYLSQMFGRYSPERLGQETSFAWVDSAISLDPNELFNRLSAHYQPLTPPSATHYLFDEPIE
jgi:uncharacterized protein YllA (UPF0747 family)